jgi:hypothetical protein
VTISADSPGSSDATIVLHIPTSINVNKLATTEAIVAHATVAADGTYTLTGADADTGTTAADDLTNAVGDFLPKHARRHAARESTVSYLRRR